MMFDSLPNLLIVGAAKSGTTSLHNYLNQHPEVFMCNPKEPHFLIINEIGKQRLLNGIKKSINYKALFSEAEKYKFRGESSVMYLLFPEIAIKNIKHILGEKTRLLLCSEILWTGHILDTNMSKDLIYKKIF